jgi:hypothetical protein
MFQTIVNQRNGLVSLRDAVNGYTGVVVRGVCLKNGDVVDRFPVAVRDAFQSNMTALRHRVKSAFGIIGCMYAGAQKFRKGRATIFPYLSVPDFDMLRTAMRLAAALIAAMFAASVFAKLPPPTDEDKAKANEAAAKAAWTDKVGLYQLCLAMDRTADAYRKSTKAAGKPVPVPIATGPCADPGSYMSPITPVASKPLEASGAHSPPGMAVSPPSTKATAAEIAGGPKK